ncbi:MAG: translesion error-prone DNA polymerase V autoproteolytic subunit [Paramuribaculum sp.]|nr:translesion error-prone DNA polymerase V autoproteolytic subunit [Paramuribaculum sp.]MDE6324454.1 translesion error-prone DNA polymerase V autoproteolytic subunit [Paramuribaculum sp.]MDE6489210.1 translesion error-prone DNA polymerase V autoproteolytic subunit [Paramuribaculum sp.]
MKTATGIIQLFRSDTSTRLELIYADSGIRAGFPSPAQDYITETIDLNRDLIQHPVATFYGRVIGDSMIEEGIEEGDLIVIDRALEATNGDLAVCCLDGEFTLKRIRITENGEIYLMPSNRNYSPIPVKDGSELIIWGIVTYTIKANRRPR